MCQSYVFIQNHDRKVVRDGLEEVLGRITSYRPQLSYTSNTFTFTFVPLRLMLH